MVCGEEESDVCVPLRFSSPSLRRTACSDSAQSQRPGALAQPQLSAPHRHHPPCSPRQSQMVDIKKRIRFVDPDRMSDNVVVEWTGNDPKRARIDADEAKAGGAAAAAAAAPSSSAASAAAAIRRDAAAAAAAAAIPLPDEPDEPTCPMCLDAFSCEETKDDSACLIPRTLPCTHSVCSGCMLQLLTATPRSVTLSLRQPVPVAALLPILRSACAAHFIHSPRNDILSCSYVKCPTCSDNRLVQLPGGIAAAAVSTPAAWMRCIPQSADIIQSIRRSQHLKLALQRCEEQMRALPSMRCSESACASPALHWCAECGLQLCTAHDASTHARYVSGHKRTLLTHKLSEQQRKLQNVRATAGAQLKQEVRSTTDRLKTVIETKKSKRQSLTRKLAQIDAAIAGHEAQLAELNAAAVRLAPLSDVDAQKHEASVGVVLSAAAVAAAEHPIPSKPLTARQIASSDESESSESDDGMAYSMPAPTRIAVATPVAAAAAARQGVHSPPQFQSTI